MALVLLCHTGLGALMLLKVDPSALDVTSPHCDTSNQVPPVDMEPMNPSMIPTTSGSGSTTSTMAPATPSLLGLPRELRDEIYSYLYHEIGLHQEYPSFFAFCGIQDRDTGPGCLTLANAPIVNLLLVNVQIKTEYMESSCFKDLTVTTEFDAVTLVMHNWSSPTMWQPPQSGDALRHVRRLDVRFNCGEEIITNRYSIWSCMNKLMDRMANDAPHLRTLRIACCSESRQFLQDHNVVYGPFTSGTFLPLQPPTYCGLSLAQRGEGYRVRKYAEYTTGFNHEVACFGAYVYHCGPAKVTFWNSGEVFDSFQFENTRSANHGTATLCCAPLRPSTRRWYSGGTSGDWKRQRLGSRLWTWGRRWTHGHREMDDVGMILVCLTSSKRELYGSEGEAC